MEWCWPFSAGLCEELCKIYRNERINEVRLECYANEADLFQPGCQKLHKIGYTIPPPKKKEARQRQIPVPMLKFRTKNINSYTKIYTKTKDKDLFQPGCVSSCVKRSLLRHITRIAEGLVHFLSLVSLFFLFFLCFALLCICFLLLLFQRSEMFWFILKLANCKFIIYINWFLLKGSP